jgi:hypothetical protein
MGAWGVSIFESDEGLDWIAALREDDDQVGTIRRVLMNTDPNRLSDQDGIAILCIAEVGASRLGAPRPGPPDFLFNPDDERVEAKLARLKPTCLDRLRMLREPGMGYRALWESRDGSIHQDWEKYLQKLLDDLENC